MIRAFDPAIRGRGFFKRTGKEVLDMKLNKKSKAIKRTTIRMKRIEDLKKKTEAALINKSEKLKKIKSELDALK